MVVIDVGRRIQIDRGAGPKQGRRHASPIFRAAEPESQAQERPRAEYCSVRRWRTSLGIELLRSIKPPARMPKQDLDKNIPGNYTPGKRASVPSVEGKAELPIARAGTAPQSRETRRRQSFPRRQALRQQ